MQFIRHFCTKVNQSKYVEKVRLLEYWRAQDDVLRKEFFRAKMLLILDKSPLLVKGTNGFQLSRHTLPELEKSLGDYGVFFDIHNSCLLDAEDKNNFWVPLFGISVKTETPPEGAPVDKKQVIRGLGDSLGGRFTDIRSAMLMVSSEEDRLLLARFYSLSKWAHVFCRCPRCAAALVTKISKASARCLSCNIAFYPNISPAIITLIKDHENSHLLLVRQRNYTPGMYTCVAGFANVGEHLHDTVRREVAEEVGIEIEDVITEDFTQPWPLPDGSLMIPNVSVADMNQPIDKCPAELENARWFSREEVQAAYDRTLSDPQYKNVPEDVNLRQELLYIPPSGVLAHRLIRKWLNKQL